MTKRSGRIAAETRDGIGWLTLDNPDRLNAVNVAMLEAIPRVLADFATDDAVRAIVVRGAGERAFSAGADISEFEAVRASADDIARFDALDQGAETALYTVPKPTVAMIAGYCVGGGVGFALCCDLRIAAETARFGVPAARLGVGYEYTGIRRLMDAVGPSFAREIFYTGRRFTAAEAHGMGLVNRVVADGELEGYVTEYAAGIAANAPLTLRAVKTVVGEALKDPAERDLERCRRAVDACFASEDYVEGRRAFMEKRTPQFRGR